MNWEKLSRIAALTTLAGVLTVSFLPLQYKYRLHTKGWLHPWGHLAIFAVSSILLFASVRTYRQRIAMTIALLAFAVAIELGQTVVFQTPFESNDVWVDSFGIILGLVLLTILRKRRRFPLRHLAR